MTLLSASTPQPANNSERPAMFSGGLDIFCLLAALFIMSQFLRVSNAVVAKELIRDLHLTAAELGTLGSAFFYAFALMQLPLGWALDRLSIRLIMLVVPLFSALGLWVFSMADGFALAFVGRVLCGIGMSVIMMGSFKIFSQHYAASYFATLSGLMISIGTLGNIFAATPLVILTARFGWRNVFLAIGIVLALLSVLAYRLLHRLEQTPPAAIRSTVHASGSYRADLLTLWRTPILWQCSGLLFVVYGSFVSLQGLWGGPYLRDVFGFSPIMTGNIILMLSLGRVVGPFLYGYLSDQVFKTRKKIVLPGIASYALLFMGMNGLILLQSAWANGVLFFLLSLAGATVNLLYPQLKESVPLHLTGLAMTSMNFFTMIGGATITQLIGHIVQRYPQQHGAYAPAAYHTAFWVCLVGTATLLAIYAFSRDTRPSVAHQKKK